jgi:pSer/pThr/pTyr-binding forkhead associated (FHA) protein
MFDLFKNDENKGAGDVKVVRDGLLRFIKKELQKSEGGEGRNIKGIHLFILDNSVDKHVYESAVYIDEPDKFKNEVQKIADDYALDLPNNWVMEITFPEEIPAEATRINNLNAGLFIRTKDNAIRKSAKAYIRILNGEAEKPEYEIASDEGKITIGREKRAQVKDGFFRLNSIAFPGDSGHESNKYISREHAHIEWNNENGYFMLFADEGGVPPGNKVKIKAANSDVLNKLNSTQIGHKLEEGDQIILGESAVIEFNHKATK